MTATVETLPEKHLTLEVQQARQDAYFFSERMLRRFDKHRSTHKIHELLHDFLDACLKESRSCVIEAPPEHGKSSQIIPMLCWLLGHRPELKIGIVAADHDLCTEHLIKARKILTHPFFKAVFPDIRPDINQSTDRRGEWSKVKLYLAGQSDPCFEAYSLFGAAEGHRLDMIFADDCVTRQCLHFENARRNSESALNDTFANRLTGEGIMIISNNCWHKEDAIHHMRASKAYSTLWLGYRGTESIYYQTYSPPEKFIWPAKGTLALWDAVWPQERLETRWMQNRVGYIRAFEARAVKSEDCRFPSMDKWARWKKVTKDGLIYGFLDPSGGKSVRKGDYAALVVLQKNGKYLDVIDCSVGRHSASEQVDAPFKMQRKLLRMGTRGFHKCQVEMLAKEQEWLKKPFRERQAKIRKKVRARIAAGKKEPDYWRVPLRIKNPTENKDARIEFIGPPIENGYLRWPPNLEELVLSPTPEGRSWALLVMTTEEWPFGDHDDGPDSLAGAIDLAEGRGGGAQILAMGVSKTGKFN